MLHVLVRDLDEWDVWVSDGIGRLERLLASYAEFERRYGP